MNRSSNLCVEANKSNIVTTILSADPNFASDQFLFVRELTKHEES